MDARARGWAGKGDGDGPPGSVQSALNDAR